MSLFALGLGDGFSAHPWIATGLMVAVLLLLVGNLAILVFGSMNIAKGKHKIEQVVSFFVPVLIFLILWGVVGDLQIAAISTFLVMIVLMLLGIVISGSRSLFTKI